MIELRAVTKTYREGERERRVLRSVDGRVAAGEVVALMGPSGSGKSTLLNLVSGIDLPTGGDVLVDGVSIPCLTERERTLFRRDHIGFVFQFFNLIPTLTVEENLLLPLELSRRTGPVDHDRAMGLLSRVGLADRADSYPDRLSAGEQQRVAVARALAHDPLLVLADEPTGNLDDRTGRRVLAMLEELARGAGKTMLVVTHSPEVAAVGDRVLELRDGKLVTR